jgi:hypothetical protein
MTVFGLVGRLRDSRAPANMPIPIPTPSHFFIARLIILPARDQLKTSLQSEPSVRVLKAQSARSQNLREIDPEGGATVSEGHSSTAGPLVHYLLWSAIAHASQAPHQQPTVRLAHQHTGSITTPARRPPIVQQLRQWCGLQTAWGR